MDSQTRKINEKSFGNQVYKSPKDDIRLGRPKMEDGTRCPVARAMKRAKIPFCIVSNEVWLDKLAWTHKLPRKVVKFITDCCHPERTVKPFSFYLRTK